MPETLKLVVISDTHTKHDLLFRDGFPSCDVVLFAGDFMGSGYRHEDVKAFGKWFSALPAIRIFIGGNHDRMLENDEKYVLSKFSSDVIYLKDSGCEVNSFKFWGSPYQPEFMEWAFNVPRGEAIRKHWDLIPLDTDVLVTHGPPHGTLDTAYPGGQHLGCEELKHRVQAVMPSLHVFGHIHGGRGDSRHGIIMKSTQYINASFLNEQYQPYSGRGYYEVEVKRGYGWPYPEVKVNAN